MERQAEQDWALTTASEFEPLHAEAYADIPLWESLS